MADEEIDRWIDGLAGKPGAEVTPDEAAEIKRLQAAIMAHALNEADAQPPPPDDAIGDQRAWQRIKSEMYGDIPTRTGRASRLAWPALATAASLLVALSITVWRSSDHDADVVVVQQTAPQYHGTVPVISVTDADPLSRAKRLARRLQSFGTKPTVYFRDGQATVEFELTDTGLAEVSKELTAQGVPAEGLAAGVVQVQFLPR